MEKSYEVNLVERKIKPTDEINITSNGSYDVTYKGKAIVNVPIPNGYLKPEGSIEFIENGEYDVSKKQTAIVNLKKQLQEKTVTPDKYTQEIEAEKGYLGLSKVTIDGVHLWSDELKKGVTRYGVTGKVYDFLDRIKYKYSPITFDFNDFNDYNLTYVRSYLFVGWTELTEVILSNRITRLNSSCFARTGLITIDLNNVTYIEGQTFEWCNNFKKLVLTEKLTNTSVPYAVVRYCENLETIDVSKNITDTGIDTCHQCYNLRNIVLRSPTLVNLHVNSHNNRNSFHFCYRLTGEVNAEHNPNGEKDCFIYVPNNLIEQYKADEKWSVYASQFKPLSEYGG